MVDGSKLVYARTPKAPQSPGQKDPGAKRMPLNPNCNTTPYILNPPAANIARESNRGGFGPPPGISGFLRGEPIQG